MAWVFLNPVSSVLASFAVSRFTKATAFVGLSKPRYKRFEGLPLDQKLKDADSEPWCGLQIIDLVKGTCVDWFRIDGSVTELYDVEVLPGIKTPMAVSPGSPEASNLVTFDKTTALEGANFPTGAPENLSRQISNQSEAL